VALLTASAVVGAPQLNLVNLPLDVEVPILAARGKPLALDLLGEVERTMHEQRLQYFVDTIRLPAYGQMRSPFSQWF